MVFRVLEQWVEIRVTEGVTTTEYVPTNAELRKMAEESEAVPPMVSEKEDKMPGGHAEPTGVGNLPRPKERGGEVSFAEMLGWLGKGRERES
jgi:hypothetical protein